MSFTEPNKFVKTPATFFLKINKKKGLLSLEQNGVTPRKTYPITMFKMVVLDEGFSTLGGQNQATEKYYKCNTRHIKGEDFFQFREDSGAVIVSGSWKTIEPKVKSVGGKMVKQVYALLLDVAGDGSAEFEAIRSKILERKGIVKMDVSGTFFTEWLDAQKRVGANNFDQYLLMSNETREIETKRGTGIVPKLQARKLKLDNDVEKSIYDTCVVLDSGPLKVYRDYIVSGNASDDTGDTPEATPDQFAADNGIPKDDFDPNWQPPTGQGYFPTNEPGSSTVNSDLPF